MGPDPIAAALAVACTDRAVLARIAGPLGEAARTAAAQLSSLGDRERRVQRATWSAAVRAPIPPGLRGIDPSWIETALAPLPGRAREALAAGPTDPASVWLLRWACARFPPMPAIEPSLARPRTPADVVRVAPAALRDWLEDVGADQLAFALGSNARDMVATMRARPGTGPGLRDAQADRRTAIDARLANAIERITRAPRHGQLGDRRGAIERTNDEVKPGTVPISGNGILRIGARAISRHLSALDRQRLALRLPRELDLAGELRAYATDERGPAWPALGVGD
ncbi:MAG TPA: hypothetical protein VM513_26935 [Kofleriaceae bacterium]|nr:hypothetical protein [Kofleriaceae bacterium]